MKLTLRPRNRVLARDLETPRFRLHSLGVREAWELTKDWRNDLELLKAFAPWGHTLSTWQWLRHGPLPDNVYRFGYAIIPKQTGRPIGLHGVSLNPGRSASCQVALSDRDWWGRDVVVEVRARLINHFFAHAPIDRFRTRSEARNTASVFIYKRLGFTHVETLPEARRDAEGRPIPYLVFEMTRQAWAGSPFYEQADVA